MLLYRDVISKDEMISDAFKIQEVDDIIYEVDCKSMMVNPGYLSNWSSGIRKY